MDALDIASRQQPRSAENLEPHVYYDSDSVSLRFNKGDIQSEMLLSDPKALVLSYTRVMAAFQLIHPEPERVAMIGLGGGSILKWCYDQLSRTEISVIEISPKVIALRKTFYLPEDDERFHVVCGDGADYVATTVDLPEVLLVDGFDRQGQPPQLCTSQFYDDCFRALAPEGLLVVNLCGLFNRHLIQRIDASFEGRVLVVRPEDGENKIVFAVKGVQRWRSLDPIEELRHRLQVCHQTGPSLVAS